MAKTGRKAGPIPVKSVERGMDLLDAVASGDHGLVALAQRAGLGPSTAYRLLATLSDRGFVSRDASTGRYRLGPKLLELSALAARDTQMLRSVSRPYLEALNAALDETTNLVAPDGVAMVYVDQLESSRPIRMFTAIGRRVPMHASAAGKAVLAASPAALLDECERVGMEALTPNTLTSRDALHRDLELIRRRGFAIDSEEHDIGVVCVAGVIVGAETDPVAAISVSGPGDRMRAAGLDMIGALIRRHAAQASEELGSRAPVRPPSNRSDLTGSSSPSSSS